MYSWARLKGSPARRVRTRVELCELNALRVEFPQVQPYANILPAGGDFLERSEKSFYKPLHRTRFCPLRSSQWAAAR